MRALRSCLGLLGTLALAGLPAPAGAQAVGSEFQINTYTTGRQLTASVGAHLVAADASGNFVVVWQSVGQDGSDDGIFGQRYDSEGVVLGSEFQVNSYTTNRQYVKRDDSVIDESRSRRRPLDALLGRDAGSALILPPHEALDSRRLRSASAFPPSFPSPGGRDLDAAPAGTGDRLLYETRRLDLLDELADIGERPAWPLATTTAARLAP